MQPVADRLKRIDAAKIYSPEVMDAMKELREICAIRTSEKIVGELSSLLVGVDTMITHVTNTEKFLKAIWESHVPVLDLFLHSANAYSRHQARSEDDKDDKHSKGTENTKNSERESHFYLEKSADSGHLNWFAERFKEFDTVSAREGFSHHRLQRLEVQMKRALDSSIFPRPLKPLIRALMDALHHIDIHLVTRAQTYSRAAEAGERELWKTIKLDFDKKKFYAVGGPFVNDIKNLKIGEVGRLKNIEVGLAKLHSQHPNTTAADIKTLSNFNALKDACISMERKALRDAKALVGHSTQESVFENPAALRLLELEMRAHDDIVKFLILKLKHLGWESFNETEKVKLIKGLLNNHMRLTLYPRAAVVKRDD